MITKKVAIGQDMAETGIDAKIAKRNNATNGGEDTLTHRYSGRIEANQCQTNSDRRWLVLAP